MLDALHGGRPAEGLAAKLQLYGQFVGSWRLDVRFDFFDGTHREAEGEALFDWVLEGWAIQDLFIIPARHLREGPPQPWWRYGSTFRWYEPDRSQSVHETPRAIERGGH